MPDNLTIAQFKSAYEELISVGSDAQPITSAEHRLTYDMFIDFIISFQDFDATVGNDHRVTDVRLKNRFVSKVLIKDQNISISSDFITQTLGGDFIEFDHSLGMPGQRITISFLQQTQ